MIFSNSALVRHVPLYASGDQQARRTSFTLSCIEMNEKTPISSCTFSHRLVAFLAPIVGIECPLKLAPVPFQSGTGAERAVSATFLLIRSIGLLHCVWQDAERRSIHDSLDDDD